MAKTEAEIKILADLLLAGPPLTADFKTVLEHARGQFQYHADQRIRSIQYFFLAYAIFAAAYAGTFKLENSPPNPHFFNFFLCLMGLIVSLAFWALDRRNVQLVEIDEEALAELEEVISLKFRLASFAMTARWETAPRKWIYRYRIVINILFAIIAIISLVAALNELREIFHWD
jgi:hypothetical protein